MFTERVIPLLREKMPPAEDYVSLTLKTACTGESTIERQVAPALEELVRQVESPTPVQPKQIVLFPIFIPITFQQKENTNEKKY